MWRARCIKQKVLSKTARESPDGLALLTLLLRKLKPVKRVIRYNGMHTKVVISGIIIPRGVISINMHYDILFNS